ncbi:MAG TPA: hypothetical protein VN696_05690 [Pyrinomonadaceae bacterium]|nr:hypothetical protein [Pyrinomonadaceae bacterium]
MTEEELNQAKHELERERFEFDKQCSRLENKFLHRNSAAIISASISIAVLSVSIAQVWVARIDKQREANAADSKQKSETLRQTELDDRQWNYDSLRFLADNKDVVFGAKSDQQEQLLNVMIVTFPPRVLDSLLHNIKVRSNNPTFGTEGEKRVDASNLSSPTAEGIDLPADILDNPQELVRRLTSADRMEVSNSLIKLYEQNPSRVVTALTNGTLPESDPNSYRNNLYIGVTLGRIPNGWKGPLENIAALTGTRNYGDPTFKKWVDIALKNHKS